MQSGIDKVMNDLGNQQMQLQQIEQSIHGIIDLQGSFSGQGGNAIKSFFESYHLSFLRNLLLFYDEYMDILEKIKKHLQLLEPATNGFIKESFLEHEVSNGLKATMDKTATLTEEANNIILSVADIVALPNLDASFVFQGIVRADQERDMTIGQLHTFDLQLTSSLLPLENNVHAMIQYVQQVLALSQARTSSIPSIESNFHSQDVLKPPKSLFMYSSATLNQLNVWENFYLNYLKSSLNPKFEPIISSREVNQVSDPVEIFDEDNGIKEIVAISGEYYTLPKVKNVLNPDKVTSFAKDLYKDYFKKGKQVGHSTVVKKIANTPTPFSPNKGMPITKTINEEMREAK